ncbi:hypothetical protein V8C35DRAFT_327100 [Trichoderma chlorosporum]
MAPERKTAPKNHQKAKRSSGADRVEGVGNLVDADYTPILRCENLNDWRRSEAATNFRVAGTAVQTPDDDANKIRRNAETWRGLAHVTGVQVLHKWNTEPKNITALAGYHGFNERSLTNFVDTVICDIVPGGLKLLNSKFRVDVAQTLSKELASEISSLPESMDTILASSRARINALPSTSSTQNLIGPVELIAMYTKNGQLKKFIDDAVRSLKTPTFLPITRHMISQADAEDDAIDPVSTVLIHAVQILLFAPTNWTRAIKYSRLTEDYQHRYPTPPGHGGDCRTVAGMYSLEDLHRSIILVYLAIYRRASGTEALKTSRVPQPHGVFAGYYDVERQVPDYAVGQEGPAELAMVRLKVLLERIREQFKWDDPDEVFARVSEDITSFKTLIGDQQFVEFTERGSTSTAIQEFLALHPEDEKGLNTVLSRSYVLEKLINSQPPSENTDINAVCSRFQIKPFPSLELYPDQSLQPLKPHQVVDLGAISEKLDTLGHVLLSNGMGLGKTKDFLSMIECRARELEAKFNTLQDGESDDLFFPTLIVNPPSTIHQTHSELKSNFPSLTVLLYYSSKSQSRKFDSAKIVEKSEFLESLRKLSNKKPQTARTVILTTYNTIHCREVSRTERRFIFLDRKEDGPAAKRRKTMTPTHGDGSTDAAISTGAMITEDSKAQGSDDDDEYYTPEQMLAFHAQRTEANAKVRKYIKGDWELANKKLQFLRDGEKVAPDGVLVEYKLKRPALADIKFGLFIVDDAHNAWTPLMESLQDITSPLSLIWAKLGIANPPSGEIGYGYTQGLWDETYDPNVDNTWPDGEETQGIFTEKFMNSYPSEGWGQMREFYERTGIKIWQLNPSLVDKAGRGADWSIAFGQKVMSVVLKMVSLRRTLRSRLILPTGQVCFPAADLLPMTIITEELSFDPSRRALVQDHGRNMATRAFMAAPSNSVENFTPSRSMPAHSSQEGSLNFSAYREGVLVAYDWRNTKILYSNVEKIFGGDPDAIANTLRLLRDSDNLTISQIQCLQRRASKNAMPTAEFEHAQKLVSFENNAGLDYFFTRTYLNPEIQWLTATSPILARTIELCHRYVQEKKERVLIHVDIPWIQQMMYGALLMGGFKTLIVRSSDKPRAATEAVNQFSNSRSGAQILIANINTISTGVNLHHACCIGILATLHYDAKTLQQVHGRLNRLGQKKAVTWHNLKVKDSFNDHQERMLLTKWSRQLSAESNLPDWMTGALREIMLFEFIRAYFNQPFNRYGWVILSERDGKALDYYSAEAIKLGYACSLLAKVLLLTQNGSYWTENDDYIAVVLLDLVAGNDLETIEDWFKLDEAQLQITVEQTLRKHIGDLKKAQLKLQQVRLFSQKVKERQQPQIIDMSFENAPGGSDTEDQMDDEDAEFATESDV